jgi:hypothetical protein
VSQSDSLSQLERLIEGFLDRVVELKAPRLEVLDGINRLDDIARGAGTPEEKTDRIGDWFAGHNKWLTGTTLRPADKNRIYGILDRLRTELVVESGDSPAIGKIAKEIERWQDESRRAGGLRIVLKRGPEETQSENSDSSLTRFAHLIDNLKNRFTDQAESTPHLLSVLDDSLKSANQQGSKEALILSALIIYYLKQENYKVDPYVQRLKQAEKAQKGGVQNA